MTAADQHRALELRAEIAALEARAEVYRDALRALLAPTPPAPAPLPPREDVAEHAPPLKAAPGTCDWIACGRPLTSPPAPKCGAPERHEGGCC